MKTIIDVLEKLKVDDIVLTAEFPIDETNEDMIAFLENEGFTHIKEHTDYPSKVFNSKKDKCLYTAYDYIIFADTSEEKISKNNPVFLIGYTLDFYNVFYVDQFNEATNIVKNNKKKFLEELNKRFGWK